MSNWVYLYRPGHVHVSGRRAGDHLHDGSQVTGERAVALGTGTETIVIEGTTAEMRAFAQKILDALI